jgi:hypothetical protein
MAYDDWMPEFQDLWDSMAADLSTLDRPERELAEYMFEEGFMTYEGEAPHADIAFARETFFDLVFGEEYEDPGEYFDWQGWREAMGYE